MPIPNLKTPGTYLDVNINTQRTGLPANTHKVLFITNDEQPITTAMPISIYDKAKADQIYGADSEVGRMITAAIKTNRVVDVQGLGKPLPVVDLNCLATSINTSFPEFFTNVPDAVYYLSFEVTENNVTTTKTASFNSDTQSIYTYAAIFSETVKKVTYSIFIIPKVPP